MARRVAYTFVAKDQFSRVARNVGKQTKAVKNQFRGLSDQVKKTGTSIKNMGGHMKGMSAVAGVALGFAVKSFGDLESAIVTVNTLMANKEAAEKYSSTITRLAEEAKKLGFTTEDVGGALFDQISKMGANEKSFEAFRKAQVLAIGGNTTLRTSVLGIANIMNAYNLDIEDLTEVQNAFFTAQRAGSTEVKFLAKNVGKISGTAADAGIGFKTLLAAMSETTQGGLSTEEATTSLVAALNAMIGSTGRAAEILKFYNIPAEKTELRNMGLIESLRQINRLNKAFPNRLKEAIPAIEASRAITKLTDESLQHMAEVVEQVGIDIKEGTGLAQAFTDQMGTLNRAALQTSGSLSLVASSVGEQTKPAFISVTGLIRAASDKFLGFSSATKTVVAAALAVAAVAAPVFLTVGAAMTAFGSGGLFLAAVFSTVGINIVAAIAAIGAATAAIADNWDFLIEKASQLKNVVSGFIGGLFGGEDLNITGSGSMFQKSQTDINIAVNAPKGVIGSIKSVTTGAVAGLSLGVNMAEQT